MGFQQSPSALNGINQQKFSITLTNIYKYIRTIIRLQPHKDVVIINANTLKGAATRAFPVFGLHFKFKYMFG